MAIAAAWATSAGPTAAEGLTPHPDRPKLIVSNETTHFTEPVTPAGTVDFFAALNHAAQAGVAPDQNAVRRILPLLPESDRDDDDPGPLAAALGLDLAAAHANGPRLTPIPWNHRDDHDPFSRALDAPWTPDDLPAVARWLQTNTPALDALDQAVRLPDSYWPIVRNPEYPLLLGVDMSGLGTTRAAARMIVIRMHTQWAAGHHEQALHSLETLLLLGQHTSKRQALISSLVAISIHSLAHSAAGPLLNDPELPAEPARRLLRILQQTPELVPIAATIGTYERAVALEVLQTVYANSGPIGDDLSAILKLAARSRLFDINLALQEVNRLFDQAEQAASTTTFIRAGALGQQLDDELVVAQTVIMRDPDKPLSERFSLKIARLGMGILMPALTAANRSELQYRSREELLLTAAALTVHRLDHGRYPQRFADLVPDYLPKLPVDRYDGRPLTYKPCPEGQNYLLYGIGTNGEDDGGVFDWSEGDISIGNPLPEGW